MIVADCGCVLSGKSKPKTTPMLANAKAAAAVAITTVESPTPTPTPQPVPGGEVCKNCKGKGKVGDGTVFSICVECDGTGKAKAREIPAFTINMEAIESLRPSRRVQTVIVGDPSCGACQAMYGDCLKNLLNGWVMARGSDPAEVTADADIVYDENRKKYEVFGVKPGSTIPTTLIFADGEVADRIVGKISAAALADRINAVVRSLKPKSESFGGVNVATIEAKDEIEQIISHAEKFLGDGGSLTFSRPAGVVDLGKVVITFPAQTTVVAKCAGGVISLTCNPPPRVKIEGVPILKPAIAGASISRDAIAIDLLRWPDVTIRIK